MDSHAYLKSHGWRGLGYSLDKSDRGLKKPLLVSQKSDVLGVGKHKHNHADQWWLRAFDDSLKQIGTGKKVRSPPLHFVPLKLLTFDVFYNRRPSLQYEKTASVAAVYTASLYEESL